MKSDDSTRTRATRWRDRRALAWLGGFSLDVRLAGRLLARYPVMTLAGAAAMAFGIAAGVSAFELRTQLVDPPIPLDEGARLVGLRYWDASRNLPVRPTPADVAAWRDRLTLVEDVGAFTSRSRNVITEDGGVEIETVAAMSPSAFRLARVPALLGRSLVDADAVPGAPPVVVIGHDLWQRRFAGDRGVLGSTLRVGHESRIVVGVMPPGFVFPAAHDLWIPLPDRVAAASEDESERLVFGRLAAGVSREQAQAELSAIGTRVAAAASRTDAHLQPQLVPFAWLLFDPGDMRLGLALANVFVVMLLVLVSANVALLMFARASTRQAEIVVRSALGAGRARIVLQLVVEALALAGLAVVGGIAAAQWALRSLVAVLEADAGRRLPFWVSGDVTAGSVIYAGVLTIAVVAIIGIVPALSVTGRDLHDRLRQATPGGGGFRFGGVWTAVIAAQVAATLMFPAAAFFFHRWVVEGRTHGGGLEVARYLSARVDPDRAPASGLPQDAAEEAFRARVARTYAEIERRLSGDPQVGSLTFADALPGTRHPRWRIEIEGEAPVAGLRPVSSAAVAVNFFETLRTPVLAGRAFTAADVAVEPRVVIVNEAFIDRVLGGAHPLGRRMRRLSLDGEDTPGPWLEIVGVVRNLGMLPEAAGFYRPVSPEQASVLRLLVGVKGQPQPFASRLRAVASEVEPAWPLHDVMPLDRAGAGEWLESQYLSRVLAVSSTIALLLSLTAIYAVMAFTVSQRTREIGIRVALGADRWRVMAVICRRPLTQVGLGVLSGVVLVAITFVGLYDTVPTALEAFLLAAYALTMMAVCLLACVGPARRALAIDPARTLTTI